MKIWTMTKYISSQILLKKKHINDNDNNLQATMIVTMMTMMIMLKVLMLHTVHLDDFWKKTEKSTYQVVCHINNM